MSTIEITEPYKVLYETNECVVTIVKNYYVLHKSQETLDLDNHNFTMYVTKCGIPTKKLIKNEYNTLLNFDHDNIIKVISYNNITNTITLEYVSGCNLIDFINGNNINESNFKHFAKQMINAVRYIHNSGYVHRDIKPDNFVVSIDNVVKLIDFEFAIQIGKESNISGTKEYIAPEIVRECLDRVESTTKFSTKSDIWSLGVTLFCVRYGKSPFLGDTNSITFNLILNRNINFKNDDFNILLKGMLDKDENSRYSMDDIVNSQFYLGD